MSDKELNKFYNEHYMKKLNMSKDSPKIVTSHVSFLNHLPPGS
jgi:hypothetical protein